MEYSLSVDESTLREVEVDAGTQKFLGEHRNVEVIGVISCKVAVFHFLIQFLSNLLECRSILHVIIADAGQLSYFLRNGLAWIYELVLASFLAVGHNLNVRKLDYAVAHEVKSCCLKVEDNKRSCKI